MADLLKLTPNPGYVDPGEAKYPVPQGPTYTSGTYNEALTGHYYTNRPDMSLSDSRPLSHAKALSRDRSGVVAVRGGEKPLGAQRGVGQPSLDGFVLASANEKVRQAQKWAAIQSLLYEMAKNNLLGSE